ncbi:hypothetical protein [Prochlorococcus marinus]|uniref:Spore protein YkvP/CgeB glycosyl transferase-like domain-containing protein n=1 Tax=Prochlorococcus marinus str. MIT 9401 TaxID=167551 RepID=A0A0A2BD04_PROMR|nr:hypothetical protein [Prochlorococcus marinus]KGG05480.1 hypothetical protein EV00_1114 [Prochlorococcus marinus str. MIT 9322]KGG10514.1 hypothetical protein EV01_0142 [Prochlorococcus marinus str. MIT 9401]
MKIILIGSFLDDWSTNNEMFKALQSLNHDVIKFDYRKDQKKPNFIYFIVDKFFSFGRRFDLISHLFINIYTSILGRKKIVRNVLKLIKKEEPDLIIVCKCDTLKIKTLEKYKDKLIYYFMDPLKMAKKIRTDINSSYCKYSISTFGKVSKNLMFSDHNRHYLQGVDKNIFNIKVPWEKRKDKIVFVANITTKRKKFINFFKKQSIPIDCYGLGWENSQIYLKDLNFLYNEYKYVLNLCQDNYGFSVRVQQAISSGCVVFSDYCQDFKTFTDLLRNFYSFNNQYDFKDLWNQRKNIFYSENIPDLSWSKIMNENFKWINSQ